MSSSAPVGLLSIGYEGRTAAELITTLLDAGVTMLVDVRLTPLSRKPGLSRQRLQAALEDVGIAYRHVSALGNPKDNRERFRTGDVTKGRKVFAELLIDGDAADAVAELALACQTERVAVLCFEREHDRCHRQVVVEAALEHLPSRGRQVAYA